MLDTSITLDKKRVHPLLEKPYLAIIASNVTIESLNVVLLFTAVCGGEFHATSTEQFIESPGYTTDRHYQSQQECTWLIKVIANQTKEFQKITPPPQLLKESTQKSIHSATNHSIEFFRIEFYRIYRIYRICRKLFLVVLKMKITKNNLLQIL